MALAIRQRTAAPFHWPRRLARLRRLGRGNTRMLLSAWVRLLAVDLSVRCVGVRRTARMAPRTPLGARSAPVEHWHAQNYARWLRVAARHHLVRAECLHQSLALHQWLRARGASSTFVIGVTRASGELRAHAWVRLDGRLVGDVDAAVAPFAELTADGAEPWL